MSGFSFGFIRRVLPFHVRPRMRGSPSPFIRWAVGSCRFAERRKAWRDFVLEVAFSDKAPCFVSTNIFFSISTENVYHVAMIIRPLTVQRSVNSFYMYAIHVNLATKLRSHKSNNYSLVFEPPEASLKSALGNSESV